MTNKELEFITKQFFKNKKILFSKELQGGNINQTYLVELGNSISKKYILQRINTSVFKKPEVIISNFLLISKHIQNKITISKDFLYKNFKIYPISTGAFYFKHPDYGFWRLIDYIDAESIDNDVIDSKIATQAGKMIGHFHYMLSDIIISDLYESIPNFHHTNLYYKQFLECTKKKSNRLEKSIDIFKKIKKYSYLVDEFSYLKRKKILPKRLVHNDPKLDNILFNSERKACTMIDLDTCMPGYLNTDFGDAIRSIANTSSENEKDLDKVHFNINIYEHFTKAYLFEVKSIITPIERKYLVFFALLITYEQLLRFYNDYIQNDIYYKIEYPKHNLQRAKVQLKLLEEMIYNLDKMKAITAY